MNAVPILNASTAASLSTQARKRDLKGLQFGAAFTGGRQRPPVRSLSYARPEYLPRKRSAMFLLFVEHHTVDDRALHALCRHNQATTTTG